MQFLESFASCHCCARNFEYLNWLFTRTCGAGRPHVGLCPAILVFNVKKIMLKCEHFWKCTSGPGHTPLVQISKHGTGSDHLLYLRVSRHSFALRRNCSTFLSHNSRATFFRQESAADARVSDSAVIPRWTSSAILNFIEPEIAPFDPPILKTLT